MKPMRNLHASSPLLKSASISIVDWGYIGIMENKMETTILGLYRDV